MLHKISKYDIFTQIVLYGTKKMNCVTNSMSTTMEILEVIDFTII
jgi:hypothetical protein